MKKEFVQKLAGLYLAFFVVQIGIYITFKQNHITWFDVKCYEAGIGFFLGYKTNSIISKYYESLKKG